MLKVVKMVYFCVFCYNLKIMMLYVLRSASLISTLYLCCLFPLSLLSLVLFRLYSHWGLHRGGSCPTNRVREAQSRSLCHPRLAVDFPMVAGQQRMSSRSPLPPPAPSCSF